MLKLGIEDLVIDGKPSARCTGCGSVTPIGSLCADCGRLPNIQTAPCPACDGTGIVNAARLPWNEIDATCRHCNGSKVTDKYLLVAERMSDVAVLVAAGLIQPGDGWAAKPTEERAP